MAGVPLAIVQRLAGHSDAKMTQRYTHLAPQTVQEAVNTLDVPDPEVQAAIEAIG